MCGDGSNLTTPVMVTSPLSALAGCDVLCGAIAAGDLQLQQIRWPQHQHQRHTADGVAAAAGQGAWRHRPHSLRMRRHTVALADPLQEEGFSAEGEADDERCSAS